MEVMPLLAALMVCTAWPIWFRTFWRSLARALRACEVKNADGLSRAELTFLPVARRSWVVAARDAVSCSASRFWRTAALRIMPDIVVPFWSCAFWRVSAHSCPSAWDHDLRCREPCTEGDNKP